MGKYFGTDGIRGKANVDLTADLAFKVGKSLSILDSKTVVIGSDTRISSDMIVSSIASGAMSVGLDVIKAGITPTPLLSYYATNKEITGVMITASHNPYYDNGIKVFNKGKKLFKEEELKIEALIEKNEFENAENVGRILKVDDITDLYEDLADSLSVTSNKKIGLDLAHGATYKMGEKLFSKVCSNLFVTANQPDGYNINKGVGSTHLESIRKLVLENGLDIGFSIDGDGDRLLVVDSKGILYDGDLIVYIIANYLKDRNLLNNNTVVFTKMSNLGVINKLKDKGINVVLTDVGDKYVLEELVKNNYSIGGENSGHIIMPGILKTGDGVLAALSLLKVIEETNKSLKELTSDVYMYPDKLVNVKVIDKSIVNNKELLDKVSEIKNTLKEKGKVLVRASGTEPLVRVSVSGETSDIVKKYINELLEIINKYNK